jgi:hypothetical protein
MHATTHANRRHHPHTTYKWSHNHHALSLSLLLTLLLQPRQPTNIHPIPHGRPRRYEKTNKQTNKQQTSTNKRKTQPNTHKQNTTSNKIDARRQ